jgi:hypothetical protein
MSFALFGGVGREVLVQTFNNFFHATLDILVQRRDDGRHIFSAGRLVVRVVVAPDGRAGLQVVHL